MVKIARTSPFSGKVNTVELPLTEVDFHVSYIRWENGMLIQDAFPTLTAGQREFLKTGITPEEWDRVFGKEE